MKIFKKSLICAAIFLTITPFNVFARDNVNYWYIKNFDSEIVTNKDSSLLITEKITADCGNAYDKHGIFRILPTQVKTEEGAIKTPVELISITDFNGNPLKYTTIKNPSDNTITWKIGDADITVQGVNYYKIVYRVKNAIRFQNPDFDELYWNLNGNFWDLETDNFTAKIIFPSEVSQNNSQIDYYTGLLGSKSKNLAVYKWLNDDTLEFSSTRTLMKEEGITASITFPKGIFTPYQPTFSEKYGGYFNYLWFLPPIIIFILLFRKWWKEGKDLPLKGPIIALYEIPENLKPAQVGVIMRQKFEPADVSATIIDWAVNGYIRIEEIQDSWISNIFKQKDYKLVILKGLSENGNSYEKKIWEAVFGENKKSTKLSTVKNNFYENFPEIKKEICAELTSSEYFTFDPNKKFWHFNKQFFIFLFLSLGFPIALIISDFTDANPYILFLSFLSVLIIFSIFTAIMPKRTQKGADSYWKILCFKEYLNTAEKYRLQFTEKENIFEKFLPYAMIFGMTNLWIKKMKEIYGEQYFNTHLPLWYVGTNMGSFDVDSFTSALNNISSSMSSNTGGSSGAGGGGGSGGGGGGGGGGGW